MLKEPAPMLSQNLVLMLLPANPSQSSWLAMHKLKDFRAKPLKPAGWAASDELQSYTKD